MSDVQRFIVRDHDYTLLAEESVVGADLCYQAIFVKAEEYDALAREVEVANTELTRVHEKLERWGLANGQLVQEKQQLERQLAEAVEENYRREVLLRKLGDELQKTREKAAADLAEAQQRIAELEARKPSPPIGTPVDCLVCGRIQPWGIWHEPTGVAVCVVCRDKAREL